MAAGAAAAMDRMKEFRHGRVTAGGVRVLRRSGTRLGPARPHAGSRRAAPRQPVVRRSPGGIPVGHAGVGGLGGDRLLPFETGQEVARAWSLPPENVFELNVGHLAMPVALMRDSRPMLRLKAVINGAA